MKKVKKIRLKKWVKYVLFLIVAIILSIIVHAKTQKEYDKVSKCMAQGYTQNYCEHITGNY